MNNVKKIKKYQEAEKDYISGMSLPQIASKYEVKEATVKKWIKRHGWKRTEVKQNLDKKTEIIINGLDLYKVREELINQLDKIGKKNIQNIVEIESYISCIKSWYAYEADLEKRGHLVETKKGIRQNESEAFKLRMNAERRRILAFLNLDDVVTIKDVKNDRKKL